MKLCILNGVIFRIIKELTRDVIPEESHIFHDWESPFKRTIRLIGDTKWNIRYTYEE